MNPFIRIFTGLLFLLFIQTNHAQTPASSPTSPDTIRVKGDWYYPPYEFLNNKGEPDGFNVELFEALARELGLNYTLELGPWSQVREELVKGEIDVILGLMVSPARAEQMDFGIPHSVMIHGIFTRKGDRILSLAELAGKEIIVQESDLMHEFLLETGLTDHVIAVSGQLEALTMLNQGHYDAAIVGSFQGSRLIREHQLENIELQTSNIEPRNYGMAVKKGDSELLALLNMGLYQLKASGVYDALYTKWFSVYEDRAVWKRYRPLLLTMLGFFIMLAVFILLLRIQVRKTTRKLQESESRYRNVFQNKHTVMLLVDPESGQIIDANPAAEQYYGWSQEELRNMSVSEINVLSPEEELAEMEKSKKLQNSSFSFIHRLKNGQTRHVEVFSGPVTFGERRLLFSIVHDVNDRKMAEASNRELEAFAYSISHDLRAPLRAMDGFSRILLEDHADKLDQEGKRVCHVIMENTRKMSQLINDLLTFSKLSRVQMQLGEVNMERMVYSVYQELAGQEKQEQVEFTVEQLPLVQGDPAMLRQVWANLINNALKFTAQIAHPQIRITAKQENRRFLFVVEDNGAGFDPQYSDKLFKVFHRLHSPKEFEGSGVGLAIVKQVVERHGGRVWARGEPGKGARFYFSLPGPPGKMV
ncbi:MAG: transporter substrate-binding domain-containing protein [Bacteroidales bacterium]